MNFSTLRLASASIVLMLAGALASAAPVQAQASGTLVITIEGSLGPSAPPEAPAVEVPPPPVVVVEPAAPVAPAVVAAPVAAPAPLVLTPAAPAVYGQTQALALDGAATPTEAPRMRRRWGLVGAGAGMALGAYALNIGGTVLALALPTYNSNRGNLFFASLVPIAGPLMQIGFRDGDWQIPLFLASSALQIAGWIMAFVGTFSRVPVEAEETAFMVLPYATEDGAGLTAGGTF